jgi:hypothetical protein
MRARLIQNAQVTRVNTEENQGGVTSSKQNRKSGEKAIIALGRFTVRSSCQKKKHPKAC